MGEGLRRQRLFCEDPAEEWRPAQRRHLTASMVESAPVCPAMATQLIRLNVLNYYRRRWEGFDYLNSW